MTDERYERMVEIMMQPGPRLIDIGRGVVDARHIVAVYELAAGDYVKALESGALVPFPPYAKTQVVLTSSAVVSPTPAAVIVSRWRQALGGLPEPIGASDG